MPNIDYVITSLESGSIDLKTPLSKTITLKPKVLCTSALLGCVLQFGPPYLKKYFYQKKVEKKVWCKKETKMSKNHLYPYVLSKYLQVQHISASRKRIS